jgi:anti-sigma regulatory factor (Ser/Thr protein kinase)
VATRRADPDALRGFGISIMHALMDGVQYEGRGSRVCLRKRLRCEADGEASEQTKEA